MFDRRTAQRNRQQQSGMTLIEMIVAISIIAILVSLTIPAVQASREASRRMMCGSQLRQTGLAVHAFEATHKLYPTNGGPAEDNFLIDVAGQPFTPNTFDLTAMQSHDWGVGSRKFSVRKQTGSWAYQILPQIEQAAVQETNSFEAAIPIYHCPSQNRFGSFQSENDAYGLYRSGGLSFGKVDYCMNDNIAVNRPEFTKPASVRDGLANTLLIGEKAIDPDVQDQASWFWDEPFWFGGSKGTARSGDEILRNVRGAAYRDNWGSLHSGGSQFARADGSLVFITQTIDKKVLEAAFTIDGNDDAQNLLPH